MSSQLFRLASAAFRRRGTVLAIWLAVLVAFGALALTASQGTADDFTIPGTESQEALDSLANRFPEVAGASAQVVVVVPEGDEVADAPWRHAIADAADELENVSGVATVLDPFADDVEGALSDDGRAAMITAQLDALSTDVTDQTRAGLEDAGAALRDLGAQVELGGSAYGPTSPGISITEAAGVLIALIVLVVTLGSIRAGGIPLVAAVVGAGVSMALIFAGTAIETISSAAPLLALMIGLAVGIDYSLFIISRHREHLAKGMTPERSAALAVGTAGSAVVFAGGTVVIALLALAVAGLPFLTLMGIAAAAAVVIAVLVSLTLIPALLGFAGTRITPKPRQDRSGRGRRRLRALFARRRKRAAHSDDADASRSSRSGRSSRSKRWVGAVTRWPALTVAVVVLGLGAIAIPAKDLALALPDNGTADASSTQRKAFDLTSEHFGAGFNGQLLIMLDIVTTSDPVGVVDAVADQIAALPDVASISLATPNPSADTGAIVVIPASASSEPETADLVNAIRDLAPQVQDEYGVEMKVTGQTALEIDVSELLAGALLPFGIVVVGLSIVLLAIVFRSVVVPLTATIGYLLSLFAAFGVVAAIFHWGWAADVFNVQRVGPVISFLPIILMGVLFGLAMDYQVFLVSRMREAYVKGAAPRAAVTEGFVSAGTVVLAAATIMVAVFGAFIPQGDAMIKPIAVGLAAGVFFDAFIVRMTLIPAVMALFGRAAWWLPGRLERILPHFDIEGEAIERQLALLGEDRVPRAVEARSLSLRGDQGDVFSRVDLDVPPNSLFVIHAPQGSGKTALLLTLSGRMTADEGSLVVADLVLPDNAALVQRRVSMAEFPGINDLDPAVTIKQHVFERVAMTRFRPWVTWTPLEQVLDFLADCVPEGTRREGDTLVASLTPLEHKLLSVALALMDRPQIVVVDDVDSLRTFEDRIAFLTALERLTDPEDPTHWPGITHGPNEEFQAVTVIATLQESGLLAGLNSSRMIVHTLSPAGGADGAPAEASHTLSEATS